MANFNRGLPWSSAPEDNGLIKIIDVQRQGVAVCMPKFAPLILGLPDLIRVLKDAERFAHLAQNKKLAQDIGIVLAQSGAEYLGPYKDIHWNANK